MFSLIYNKIRISYLEGKYQGLIKKSQERWPYNQRESERIMAKANELFQKIAQIETTL